jgi:hypothetical protein
MVGTVTYSGVIGPGQTLTSAPFTNVHSVKFNYDKEVIEIEYDNPLKMAVVDMRATTTITPTVVAGVSVALTIS